MRAPFNKVVSSSDCQFTELAVLRVWIVHGVVGGTVADDAGISAFGLGADWRKRQDLTALGLSAHLAKVAGRGLEGVKEES